MGVTTAIQPKPFINHFSQAFLESRKGLDKTTKLMINGLELARWGLDFSDSTASVGDTLGTVAKEMKYVRSVIKLVDIFDSVKVPDEKLEGFDLALHITQSAAFGVADLIEITEFLNDVNAIELGKSACLLAQIGNAFAAVGLSANLIGDVNDLNEYNKVINDAKNRLVARLNPCTVDRDGHPTLDYDLVRTALEEPRLEIGGEVPHALPRTGIDDLNDLVKAEIGHKRTALDIAQTVFDIAAVVFAFVVATLLLPLVIAVPVLATLGIASATTGLCKLWSQTSNEPEIADVADYITLERVQIPAERFRVHLKDGEVLPLPVEQPTVVVNRPNPGLAPAT